MKRLHVLVVFVLAGIVWAASRGLAAGEIYLVAAPMPVPATFFGMHIHNAAPDMPWPSVRFGAWRLSDAAVSWPHLEPRKGQWNFERLDWYVKATAARGVEVLLPLSHSPRWASARPDEPSAYHRPGWAAEPRDIEDWRHYVRTVATRYRGRIRLYEVWNEPNMRNLYSGSIEKLIELTRVARETLKEVDPDIVLVSPSFVDTSGVQPLDEFLRRGGARYVDVIGYHFYAVAREPEGMLPMIERVRAVMRRNGLDGMPLWNTETGWVFANTGGSVNPTHVGFPKTTPVLPVERQPAYVSRSFILSWAAGVQRLYWYAWDNGAMGLAEDRGRRPKLAADAYARTYRWLSGAMLDHCHGTREGVWTCRLVRAGEPLWLVWSTTYSVHWAPPQEWRIARVEALNGRVRKFGADDVTLELGPEPQLVRVMPRPGAPAQQVSLP